MHRQRDIPGRLAYLPVWESKALKMGSLPPGVIGRCAHLEKPRSSHPAVIHVAVGGP